MEECAEDLRALRLRRRRQHLVELREWPHVKRRALVLDSLDSLSLDSLDVKVRVQGDGVGVEDTEDECSCAIVGARDAAGEDRAARNGIGGEARVQGEGARLTFDDG